jgi:hypothetical protein
VRRLLYLAVALVLMALTGLAFVRVIGSSEFVARQKVKQIHVGMLRSDVDRVMVGIPYAVTIGGINPWHVHREDVWNIGGVYLLTVEYNWMLHSEDEPWDDMEVTYVKLQRLGERSKLDRFLECLGYARVS